MNRLFPVLWLVVKALASAPPAYGLLAWRWGKFHWVTRHWTAKQKEAWLFRPK